MGDRTEVDIYVAADPKIASVGFFKEKEDATNPVASTSSDFNNTGAKDTFVEDSLPPPQEATIEIEQFEVHTLPKTQRHRLKQRLEEVNQLTFYPGAEIDLGTTPILTDITNERDELVLRLEHKSNVVVNEPGGIGIEKISSFFKEDFMEPRAGGNDGRIVNNRYMKFCDENGRLVFKGICEKEFATVKCGADVLGYIDGTALNMLSTPNVVAKNAEKKLIFEIAINDKNTLKPPKSASEVNIYCGEEILGMMGPCVTHKGTYFGLRFSRNLNIETKAVLITAAFLVYSSIFAKTSFGNNDGGLCCCCC